MARVFLARVDDRSLEGLREAVGRARAWIGAAALTGDVRALAAARWGGLHRKELDLLLRDATGRADRTAFISRRGETLRFQLSVGSARRHDRLPARADLYRLDGLVLAPTLSVDVAGGGVGGAVLGAARRLLELPIDSLEPPERSAVLAEVLEIAAGDLVLGDGTRAVLGLSPRAPARPLGLLLVADDALAHDAVWAEILGQDPAGIDWMVAAASLGLGTIEGIDVGGDEPLAFFQRRVQGAPRAPLELAGDSARWGAIGGPRIRVLPIRRPTLAAERLLVWLSALRDEPLLREQIPGLPPVAVLAGEGAGPLPSEDRIVALGPAARDSLLADGSIVQARAVPRWTTGLWGRLGQSWRLTLEDGRTVRVAAVDDPAPSHRAIRAAFARLGFRLRGAPGAGPDAAPWTLRAPLPYRVVHARRIERLRRHAWRQRWQPTEALRRVAEPVDGP